MIDAQSAGPSTSRARRVGSCAIVSQFVETPRHRNDQEIDRLIDRLHGCGVEQIAKSILFKGGQSGKAVMVVTSGINRVDEKKVRTLIKEDFEKAFQSVDVIASPVTP